MSIQCPYCGSRYQDLSSECPHCGAPTSEPNTPARVPQTIPELKAFCASHRMPLELMRFFIGEDYRGARAFGIYEDADGSFVVYKNKADGSRAVRYRGHDEAYAVNEIYQKLKEEIRARRSAHSASGAVRGTPTRKNGLLDLLKSPVVIALAAVLVFGLFHPSGSRSPSRGYYHYNDDYYYYQGGDWYYYDDSLTDWLIASTVDLQLQEHSIDYFSSDSFDSSYPVEDFSYSEYYDPSVPDDDWDDDTDWDYDYDSWDSGDTDWDSDW